MDYILKNEIEVDRNIVFLCGPYYQKDNPGDRRNIIRDVFKSNYKSKILPLVIDNIFDQDNFNDENINIQLLEEIFAAISLKTYVFLDTMSASAEMGLFSNHAFNNKLTVYVPYISDVLNKGLVGAFIRDGIFGSKASKVKVLEYRPKIRRSAIATDFVVEHYGFINDTVPENIEKDIKNDSVFYENTKYNIILDNNSEVTEEFNKITYHVDNNQMIINTSVKLLYVVTASIVYEMYKDILKTDSTITIHNFDLVQIQNYVKMAYFNFVLKKTGEWTDDLTIKTTLSSTFENLIYHIVTFVYMYYCRSTYKGYKLTGQGNRKIVDKVGLHPYKVFSVRKKDELLLKDVVDYPDKYYESIEIKKNGKKRELIKYRETEFGDAIRALHQKVANIMRNNYERNKASYAYHKGSSIRECIGAHKESRGFIKCDVNKFFNSIDFEKLIQCIEKTYGIDSIYRKETECLIRGFFVKGILPLGLVSSPVLSDIYMRDVDDQIGEYVIQNSYIYTRYADDIMISSEKEIDVEESEQILNRIADILETKKLKLNLKKTKQCFLKERGNSIRYIGVNIVKDIDGNYLSVGKKYIYDTVKEYLNYLELVDEQTRFYEKRRIAGKVAFILQIEGEAGWERIAKRLNYNEAYLELKQKRLKF